MAVPGCPAIDGESSTRGGFSCTPTCMPRHAADGLSRPHVVRLSWRRNAIEADQYEWCAACQLAWSRFMAVPDCPAIGGIGGARQHTWWLQMRTHVHAQTCC